VAESKHGDLHNDVFRCTLLDVAALLAMAIQGSRHPEVGYEDVVTSLERLKQILSTHPVRLKKQTLEGLLWSANMMEEQQLFWSPHGTGTEGFDRFVQRLLENSGHNRSTFDKRLNIINVRN
jgi:hypothetical protein